MCDFVGLKIKCVTICVVFGCNRKGKKATIQARPVTLLSTQKSSYQPSKKKPGKDGYLRESRTRTKVIKPNMTSLEALRHSLRHLRNSWELKYGRPELRYNWCICILRNLVTFPQKVGKQQSPLSWRHCLAYGHVKRSCKKSGCASCLFFACVICFRVTHKCIFKAKKQSHVQGIFIFKEDKKPPRTICWGRITKTGYLACAHEVKAREWNRDPGCMVITRGAFTPFFKRAFL